MGAGRRMLRLWTDDCREERSEFSEILDLKLQLHGKNLGM